ncbi:hypothetical protein ACJMK2_022355 [Sinanodonta woodiana]|uniref:Thyroglobulin type-1 domain-containing protein n=1 Tax=Sinanodonta woodiana TaxID=1069815 RepID=A0ABD3TKW6_SINWO
MFQFLLFAAILVCTQAIVCPPNFCNSVDCQDVSACNGVLQKGFCGCCDVCTTVINEGQLCLSSIFLGVPSNTACADGLHCDPVTHRCIRTVKKSLNACAARLHEIETSQQNGVHLLGVFKPTCTTDGYYAPVQCHGSVCYCATRTGVKIESYEVAIYMSSQMTCQCARDKYEYMQTGLIGKMFYCDAMGNYQNSPDVASGKLAHIYTHQTDRPLVNLTPPQPTRLHTYTNTQI